MHECHIKLNWVINRLGYLDINRVVIYLCPHTFFFDGYRYNQI